MSVILLIIIIIIMSIGRLNVIMTHKFILADMLAIIGSQMPSIIDD